MASQYFNEIGSKYKQYTIRQDEKQPEEEDVPSATAIGRRRSVKDKAKPEVHSTTCFLV